MISHTKNRHTIMWSVHYLLFCISVLCTDRIVISLHINMTEFRQVDSDFDLAKAVANFRPEDFDVRNIKGYENLGAKFNYYPPKKLPNRTSEDDRKMLEEAYALLDTSGEREHRRLLDAMAKKEEAELAAAAGEKEGKKRVKRQGKFQEAAKVSNLKMLRIYLAMISNLWTTSYLGGSHPMHKDVPKAVMVLFKHRIMEFFFPPVGESKTD